MEYRLGIAHILRKIGLRRWMLKKLIKRFAFNAKMYYGLSNYIANNRVSPLNKELVKEVLSYNPLVVFEFGCGVGKNLNLLSDKVSVAGTDVSKAGITAAKLNHQNVWVGDENSLMTMQSKSYDVVFTCSVLVHIKHIDKIIEQFKRIASKAIVIAETDDEVGKFYYAHDYEKYGFIKTGFSYRSTVTGAIYYIWKFVDRTQERS